MSFHEPTPLTAEAVQRLQQEESQTNGKPGTVIEFVSVPHHELKEVRQLNAESRQLSIAALASALLAVIIALMALVMSR